MANKKPDFKNKKPQLLRLLVLGTILGVMIVPFFTQATVGVPKIISYQGRLADSSGNLLGGSNGTSYYFKFSIWDSPTSSPLTGAQLWPSASSSVTTSTVTSGVFNVNIGDTANGYPDALTYDFLSNQDVYLQVEVSSGGSFETLSQRQRITAAGFAINASTVSGNLITSSSADYTFNATNQGSGLANFAAEGQIQVGSFNSAPTTLGGGSLYYSSTTGQLFVWNAATTTPQWVSLGGGSGGSTDLQAAYNLGNSITTTNARDIIFNSADTATDANFTFNILGSTSTAVFQIQASSTTIFSISRNAVTSTAELSWNIQGAATLSTTTFSAATSTGAFGVQGISNLTTTTISNGNLNIVAGVFQIGGSTKIDGSGQGTFATTTITSLAVSGTSTFTGLTAVGNLTFTNATGTGTFSAGASTLTSVIISGSSTITNLNFGIATGTALSLTNALGIGSGGTGLTTNPSNGQLLIGSSTSWYANTLTAGTGITIQNATGTITITSANPTTSTIIAGGTTVNGPTFTFATTTSYGGGFNIQGVTFNFPGRINDINNLATSTG
ncbi:MAG: hypothetical protein AAB432_02490, partial [Patescibacteria group bacterium]